MLEFGLRLTNPGGAIVPDFGGVAMVTDSFRSSHLVTVPGDARFQKQECLHGHEPSEVTNPFDFRSRGIHWADPDPSPTAHLYSFRRARRTMSGDRNEFSRPSWAYQNLFCDLGATA